MTETPLGVQTVRLVWIMQTLAQGQECRGGKGRSVAGLSSHCQ